MTLSILTIIGPRRRAANGSPPGAPLEQPHLESLEDHMLAEPARSWGELIEKWRFLLERYSATSDADDERIQKLIWRAIRDMESLRDLEVRS